MRNGRPALNLSEFIREDIVVSSIFLAIAVLFSRYNPVDIVDAAVATVFLFAIPGMVLYNLISSSNSVQLSYAIPIGVVGYTVFSLAATVITTPFAKITVQILAVLYVFLILSIGAIVGTLPNRSSITLPHPTRAMILLSLLPILAVLGAKYSIWYGTRLITLSYILLASISPLIIWSQLEARSEKAFGMFLVGWSVLLHTHAVTSHLIGYDIHLEYYYVRQIIQSGTWSTALQGSMGNVVTVLFPVAGISQITGISDVWVMKYVYPAFFAIETVLVWRLASVVLSNTARRYTEFAPYMFVFYFGVLNHMVGKQSFGIVFGTLFILSLIEQTNKKVLMISLMGLILSHYGTPLLFLVFLVGATVFAAIYNRVIEHIQIRYISELSLLALCWFLYNVLVSPEGTFTYAVIIGNRVATTLFTGGFVIDNQASSSSSGNLLVTLLKMMWILVVGVAAFGGLKALIQDWFGSNTGVNRFYLVLTGAIGVFIGTAIVVPVVYPVIRLLWITLPLLAPLIIYGLVSLVAVIQREIDPLSNKISQPTAIGVFVVFLFIVSSGAAFVAVGQPAPSYAASLEPKYAPIYPTCEPESAQWVASHRGDAEIGVINPRLTIGSHDGRLLASYIYHEEITHLYPDRDAELTELFFMTNTPIGRPADTRINVSNTTLSGAIQDADEVYSCGRGGAYAS
ncbi:DUF2206 domain-containing protein [Haloferax volcanii]|uniref:DUF2206 domain-containing protein n=1 Tax=Haloferax volcanii TaxID=2246 RepID=UPI00385BF2B8